MLLGDPEIAARVAELPPLGEDSAPYLVFADWLQSRGKPWGELIVLQHAARTRPELQAEVDAWLAVNARSLVGTLAMRANTYLEWELGFVRRAVLGAAPLATATAMDELKAFAACARIREICIQPLPEKLTPHGDPEASTDDIIHPWRELHAIAMAVPPTVVRLGFGGWPAPSTACYVGMPDFDNLSSYFTDLRELELTGAAHIWPGTLAMPELRVLEVRFAHSTAVALDAIANAVLPKLERLAVWMGGASHGWLDDVAPPDHAAELPYPATYDAYLIDDMEFGSADNETDISALKRMLAASRPALRELGLPSSVLDREVCEAIVGSPLLRQIERLDLSGGVLDDGGAEVLLGAAARLLNLRVLKLPREPMRVSTQEKLARALPHATFDEPDPDRAAGRPAFYFRYVATME